MESLTLSSEDAFEDWNFPLTYIPVQSLSDYG